MVDRKISFLPISPEEEAVGKAVVNAAYSIKQIVLLNPLVYLGVFVT